MKQRELSVIVLFLYPASVLGLTFLGIFVSQLVERLVMQLKQFCPRTCGVISMEIEASGKITTRLKFWYFTTGLKIIWKKKLNVLLSGIFGLFFVLLSQAC